MKKMQIIFFNKFSTTIIKFNFVIWNTEENNFDCEKNVSWKGKGIICWVLLYRDVDIIVDKTTDMKTSSSGKIIEIQICFNIM